MPKRLQTVGKFLAGLDAYGKFPWLGDWGTGPFARSVRLFGAFQRFLASIILDERQEQCSTTTAILAKNLLAFLQDKFNRLLSLQFGGLFLAQPKILGYIIPEV